MMRIEHRGTQDKGWAFGPWNSELALSIGYANQGIDEPHLHTTITEVYLVAQGTAQIRVENHTIALQAGDILVVEPGEAHTFLDSSTDYYHFVLHTPGLTAEAVKRDKQPVTRTRLGL
jgi:mannose-6-phosphate isomerase-like protein (cupin superfamily)